MICPLCKAEVGETKLGMANMLQVKHGWYGHCPYCKGLMIYENEAWRPLTNAEVEYLKQKVPKAWMYLEKAKALL